MKKIILTISLCTFTILVNSQVRLLEKPELLLKVRTGLSSTYNMDFVQSRKILDGIRPELKGHPVIDFMDALILYWENFPLTENHPATETFLGLLESTTVKGKQMLEKDPESLEGLFFDLFARALFSEFWADNGKPSKVFPYLNSLYRQTLRGMELQDQFPEFYFSSGLYNYYMEAYPQKHPAYKPIKLLFHPGDLQKGLDQLNYCAQNAIYVKNEARYFLLHIYLNYEGDLLKASEYASSLFREFPSNPQYAGLYAQILIYNHKYAIAEVIVNNLSKLPGDFAKMQYQLYQGMLEQKYYRNQEKAFQHFKTALKLGESFGKNATHFNAQAWMGLGRYYRHKADFSNASRYFKMAGDATTYDIILNDR